MAFRRFHLALAGVLVAAGVVVACGSDAAPESDDEIGSPPEVTDEDKPGKNTGDDDDDVPGEKDPSLPAGATKIPADKQRLTGDPEEGYRALVNEPYCSIGIPWTGFSFAMTDLEARDALPGREGKSALVGYGWNVGTKSNGLEIAAMSCLSCHAQHLQGKLVVGLGRAEHSFLVLTSGMASNPALISAGLTSPAALLEYQQYGIRLATTQTAGPFGTFANPSHRDPKTLEWGTATRFDATTGLRGWVDVPPWWRTKKKNALYYSGMGRGDHVRHMSNMTLFSVKDVAEAKTLDKMFVDIAAYLRSIEPPKYPGKTDAKLVASGKKTFEARCSKCHGTYGANESYPNLLIDLDHVGTDPELATKSWANQAAADWWADSYYGENSRFELHEGYVAPPLDGIWATAPFFHNGSVPTLEAVLDSSKRPKVWSSAFGDDDYDLVKVGWKAGQGLEYDTTQLGYSKEGHTFGDSLDADERKAVLEYLKTL